MKILKVIFDGVILYDRLFEIDFIATDRIMQDSGVYNLWGPINTQQTISIIGINAVGKTTSIKLLNLAMEIVLNNKGLNENLIPSIILNENTATNGIIMTVYFYKNNEVVELISKIRYREKTDGEVYFYFDEETLNIKSKSKVTSKNNIFNFTKKENYRQTKRSELKKDLLNVLRDDVSISIMETKGQETTVNTMFQELKNKINPIQGEVNRKILNVFDENLKKLEKIDGEDGINIEFKNSKAKFNATSIGLENIISSGTIKGQMIIKNAIIALKSGGYLIIDELENHLNKELVKMIISIFNSKDINKNGACIIFTTHYAEILDSFDRKDNIYVLTRDNDYFTKINKYSDIVKRNELKKSEVILSNYIKGTAPKAINIKALEEYICEKI